MKIGMPQTKVSDYEFLMRGGWLCLDFANTAGSHASDHPSEHLPNYMALVAWGLQANAIDEREAKRLVREAEHRPREATTVLARARALREVIYRIFSAIAANESPNETDLKSLNAALAQTFGRLRIVLTKDGFSWAWAGDEDALDRMLWPVVRSAAELLVSEELNLVRECANDTCGWLFLDRSKNHSRRWCDMKDCGNVAKARRYYQRHKKIDK
ncbi:ABATE domain-containing protein [Candidatus Acetothermia bacterium]|nr:ABATE domain-containing protein [Candidatus Acetothermia bacterium]